MRLILLLGALSAFLIVLTLAPDSTKYAKTVRAETISIGRTKMLAKISPFLFVKRIN